MALDDREVTFGETTFSIGKMLPVEAKKVFMEHVRPMLEGALGAQVSEGGGGIEMALGIVARAPAGALRCTYAPTLPTHHFHVRSGRYAASFGLTTKKWRSMVWTWPIF